jgi:hypothetical protein
MLQLRTIVNNKSLAHAQRTVHVLHRAPEIISFLPHALCHACVLQASVWRALAPPLRAQMTGKATDVTAHYKRSRACL